jgi:hypothetical protein
MDAVCDPLTRATQFFAVSAASLGGLRNMQNGGKRARRGIDAWDQVSQMFQ